MDLKKIRSGRWLKMLFLLLLSVIILAFHQTPSWAATKEYYCNECNQKVERDSDSGSYIHLNSACSNFGKNAEEDSEAFRTVSSDDSGETDSGDGTDTDESVPEEQKSWQQKMFEDLILANAFDMAGFDIGFTPAELLSRTFVYAIAILEGTDGLPDGYIDTDLPFENGITHEIWYYLIQAFAFIILLIRFMYTSAADSANLNIDKTPEQIVRPLIKLFGGFLLIFFAHYILSGLLYLSFLLCHIFTANVTSGSETEALFDAVKVTIIKAVGFKKSSPLNDVTVNGGALALGVSCFALPMIMNIIYSFLMLSTIFKRVIEIIVRGIMLPLAITGYCEEHDPTLQRYIKEFAAVALQGLMILVLIWVSNVVCAFMIQDIAGMAQSAGFDIKVYSKIGRDLAAIKFSQVLMIGASLQISKSVLGV